jgi:hypothetical protein
LADNRTIARCYDLCNLFASPYFILGWSRTQSPHPSGVMSRFIQLRFDLSLEFDRAHAEFGFRCKSITSCGLNRTTTSRPNAGHANALINVATAVSPVGVSNESVIAWNLIVVLTTCGILSRSSITKRENSSRRRAAYWSRTWTDSSTKSRGST